MATKQGKSKNPQGKRAPDGDRKGRIVTAALEAMIENGVAQTRLNDVAKRAHVDPPLIHYYFKDLESLHLAVIEKVLESLKDYSLRDADPYQDDPLRWMKGYTRAPLLWAHEKPEFMHLWTYFYHLAGAQGPFRTLNNAIRKAGRERIAMAIYRGIEKSVFKPDPRVSVEALALDIQTIMSGFAILMTSEDALGLEQVSRQNEFLILSLLGVKDLKF